MSSTAGMMDAAGRGRSCWGEEEQEARILRC